MQMNISAKATGVVAVDHDIVYAGIEHLVGRNTNDANNDPDYILSQWQILWSH